MQPIVEFQWLDDIWDRGNLFRHIGVIRARGGGVCVCVVTSYIWHSMDVRAEWPPFFQRCQVYNWPPFFNKKYMTDPIFLDWYMKGTTYYYDIPVYAQRFFETAYSLRIQ